MHSCLIRSIIIINIEYWIPHLYQHFHSQKYFVIQLASFYVDQILLLRIACITRLGYAYCFSALHVSPRWGSHFALCLTCVTHVCANLHFQAADFWLIWPIKDWSKMHAMYIMCTTYYIKNMHTHCIEVKPCMIVLRQGVGLGLLIKFHTDWCLPGEEIPDLNILSGGKNLYHWGKYIPLVSVYPTTCRA